MITLSIIAQTNNGPYNLGQVELDVPVEVTGTDHDGLALSVDNVALNDNIYDALVEAAEKFRDAATSLDTPKEN